MKYASEIVIDLPRKDVIRIMDNTENMKHWQKGLVSWSSISGEPGQEGSKMELHYKMGKKELVLIETILTRDFPDAFHATYDTKGVHNFQKNFFKEVGDNRTQWISETEFEFSGFFMKLMAFLMPGAFKKQSLQYMQDFKAYAEEGKSVLDNK